MQILIRESQQEIDAFFDLFKQLKKYNNSYDSDILEQLKATNPSLDDYTSVETLKDEFLIGTPEQIGLKIQQFIDKGVTHFMLWFMDFPSQAGINLFAEKVMTQFRIQG